MSFALASSRATARVAAVSASTTTSVVRVPRRFASAAFAHMKVKKNNWVEVSFPGERRGGRPKGSHKRNERDFLSTRPSLCEAARAARPHARGAPL
jgi:hypothetical protein